MNQRHFVTQRRGALAPMLMAGGIVLLALCGGALLLHATGTIQLPFLVTEAPPPPRRIDLRGKVLLPISVRPIEAYNAVVADDFSDRSTATVTKLPMPEELVPANAVRDPRLLIGRVLRRSKPAGQIFLESEFYPLGTQPGPAAGVPHGKRALRLRADVLPGLHGLRQGDRFDIVMTVEVQVEEPRTRPAPTVKAEGPYAALLDAEAAARNAEPPRVKRRRAEVRVIVKNGLLVQPIHNRQVVASASNPMRPMQRQSKPIEELIIAIDPVEVAQLNQALALDAQLQVAIRSGQVKDGSVDEPEAEIPDIAVEFEEPSNGTEDGEGHGRRVKVIEVISGAKKRLEAIPAEDEGSTPAGSEQEEG